MIKEQDLDRMSKIDGKRPKFWIEKNYPENGLFRVYWKDVINTHEGGATFDPDEGEGLRYEWYYKDGKRADGESKAWWPDGKLKHIKTWKNNTYNGKTNFWYPSGQKRLEEFYKNGNPDGLRTRWHSNGKKKYEGTYQDGELISSKCWDEDGNECECTDWYKFNL